MSRNTFGRTFFGIAAGLAAISLALTPLYPIFAFLAFPLFQIFSYMLCNLISRLLFKKDYQPPSQVVPEWRFERRWSDYLLLVPDLCLCLGLVFLLGHFGDVVSNKTLWRW